MSDIINDQSTLRKGKHFQRKTQLRIDMTPMVDLGFLLVSFFIFTTIV
jgi:biopolymer transport protein ExbD